MPHGTDTKDRDSKLGKERVALPLENAHGRKEPKRDGADSHMCAREREDIPEAIIIHELFVPNDNACCNGDSSEACEQDFFAAPAMDGCSALFSCKFLQLIDERKP